MLLPPFSLPDANGGRQISLWGYKSRRNLALLFLQEYSRFGSLLNLIAQRYSDYREINAEVLVISPEVPETQTTLPSRDLPFPILFDKDSEVRRKCLGSEYPAESGAMALIADRWGEVQGRVILHPERAAADAEELRKWLEFVDMQCGECFPPEWPAA
jgi:peroxiredoxin